MEQKTNLKRRNFLRNLGAGGAGVAATVVGGKAALDAAQQAGSPDRNAKGYRLTEHINNYYRTTRL
jgi:hypothetical protein